MIRNQLSNLFSNKLFPNKLCLAIAFSVFLSPQLATATNVRIITSLGDFTIELFDELTPITVNNFLNYVNSGRYNSTVIHRAIDTPSPFIIQGGWLSYDAASNSLNSIPTDDAIQNEPFISNLRGTVAMAKVAGDPNSATSQWFVNLDDNSANLDAQNGGFTVFGRVIGDGMTVVDQIASLPTFTVTGIPDFPLINYTGGLLNLNNFVSIAAIAAPAPNYFDEASGLVHLTVDAGASGLVAVTLSITADAPNIVIQLDLDSIAALTQTVDNMAIFDAAAGTLFIPELYISGELAFRNMNLTLSDPALFEFTLISFEEV